MAARFEELDWQQSALGEISLRRRWDMTVKEDVFEVKLNDEFLMSSLFTVAEIELARLALAEHTGEDLEVLVGGLGLGYTAREVLRSERVSSLVVVEAVPEVISWHERLLLPESNALLSDPRYRVLPGDFFALTDSPTGYDPNLPHRQFDAVIVDIDHSPRHVLAPGNSSLYTQEGSRRLARHLKDGGVFALWSNDPPDENYVKVLRSVFESVTATVVSFPNPLQDQEATNTVYCARNA